MFFGKLNSEREEEICHTHYFPKEKANNKGETQNNSCNF